MALAGAAIAALALIQPLSRSIDAPLESPQARTEHLPSEEIARIEERLVQLR